MKSAGHSQYRPDVDGLRAIAVLAVFLNHANEEWLPSGFVGVDVFFVISGFVVTLSILGRNYGGGGASALFEFWRRRILRLFPAMLVFVLFATLLFAGFFSITTAVQYGGTLKTGLTSLLGLSNLYLIRISSDYFQADQSSNVFNHTWSLGVEEQFYVLFALLAFIVPVLLGRERRNLLIWAVPPLALVSLGLFVTGAQSYPVLTYYGLHARFWELAAGAMVAIYAVRRQAQTQPRPSGSAFWQALGWAGAALLVVSFVIGREAAAGIIGPIILAVAGATCVILAGVHHQGAVARALGMRAMVAIGLWSYSIYLYHWPVLVYFRWNVGTGALAMALAFAITLALSYASYRLIERPARRYRGGFFRRVLPIYASLLVATGGLVYAISTHQGALYAGSEYAEDDWLPALSTPYAANGRLRASDCLLTSGAHVPAEIPQSCFTQDEADGARTVLVLGDSHGFAQFGMAGALGKLPGFRAAAFVHDGCAAHARAAAGSSCARYKAMVPDYIRTALGSGDIALLSLHFPLEYRFADELVRDYLRPAAIAAEDVGARLVIELPHIRSERGGLYCKTEWFRFDYGGCERSQAEMEDLRADAIAQIKAIGDELPHKPVYWDPLPDLCADGRCAAYGDSGPVLRDGNHLSASAARALAEPFAETIEAESNSNSSSTQSDTPR